METRVQKIQAHSNKEVQIEVIPGHFATNHSHVNYYVDMTTVKSHSQMAQAGAAELARTYTSTPIDTIICLEGTEVLGAFLAQELSKAGLPGMNAGRDISVITPEFNANNQMIFRDNTQKMIWNKQILLLIASASTGKTVNRSLDCLQYYSGNLVGIAAIFSAISHCSDLPVHAIFDRKDLPAYQTWMSAECPQCQNKQKIDALVNSYGYSKI